MHISQLFCDDTSSIGGGSTDSSSSSKVLIVVKPLTCDKRIGLFLKEGAMKVFYTLYIHSPQHHHFILQMVIGSFELSLLLYFILHLKRDFQL